MSKKLFTRAMFASENDESGVMISGLGNALTVWAGMNYPECSVASAMAAFNTTREVIVEAVDVGYWTYLSDASCDDPAKTMIEVDGE